MRVSLFITDTARGGAPLRLATLARGLRHRGCDVQLVSLLRAGEVARELAADGFDVVDLGAVRLTGVPRAVVRLWRSLRRWRPDVLHVALFHAVVVGRIVGRVQHIPVVTSYESVDERMPAWRRWLDRATARLSAATTAVADAVADSASARTGLDRDAIEVIVTGRAVEHAARTDVRARYTIPADAVVVGFVGRLHPVKNLDVLVEAHALLPPTHWLLVVGDGPERDLLDGRDRVVVTGMQSDVDSCYDAMDVFVLPSRWEGLPLSLIEAMLHGLPLVASAVGGMVDVIDDGRNGLLVPPGDARALATAIERAVGDRSLGEQAARDAHAAFSVDRMVEAHLALYERAISSS